MLLADALSRRPDMIPEEDHNNEDIILLPDNLFINLIDMALVPTTSYHKLWAFACTGFCIAPSDI
jgi:hypothetical protein